MITLDVLSINGNTKLANASYPVSARYVYMCYSDPTDANQTYVEICAPGQRKKTLLVDDAIADVQTTLNSPLEYFVSVTVEEINRPLNAARTYLLNYENIGVAYEVDSKMRIEYYGENTQSSKLIKCSNALSTLTTAIADITPGAETVAFPLTSKSVVFIGGRKLPAARTMVINERMVRKVIENYRPHAKVSATARARLKLETVISVANGGSGYADNEVLTLVGGGGTAATVTVTNVAPVNGQTQTSYNSGAPEGTFLVGTGYATNDTITLSDGTIITVTLAVAGNVSTFSVNSTGSTGSASNHPTLTQASTTGTGSGFALKLGDSNQRVYAVSITTAGSYYELPTAIATVATTASANGTGATLNVDFEVVSVEVVEPGLGYTSAPTVTISGGGGTGATATASVSGSKVTEYTVGAAGNNFTSIPTVAVTEPDGFTNWIFNSDEGADKEYAF